MVTPDSSRPAISSLNDEELNVDRLTRVFTTCVTIGIVFSGCARHMTREELVKTIDPATSSWDEQIDLAKQTLSGAEFLRYVEKDFLPYYQAGLEGVLRGSVPTYDPGSYKGTADFGWLVTYWPTNTNVPPYWQWRDLPEVAVFLQRETCYLDILLRQRGGWTHQLKKPVIINDEAVAEAVAEKYLQNLGIGMEGFAVKVFECVKFSYAPMPWRPKDKPEYAATLFPAFTVYSGPALHGFMLRHEFIGTKGIEQDYRQLLHSTEPGDRRMKETTPAK